MSSTSLRTYVPDIVDGRYVVEADSMFAVRNEMSGFHENVDHGRRQHVHVVGRRLQNHCKNKDRGKFPPHVSIRYKTDQ